MVSDDDALVRPAAYILAHSSFCTVSIKILCCAKSFFKNIEGVSESIIHVVTRAITAARTVSV
jgi:hypothetical protein